MAKTDKEQLVTGFWNRIESNQATDCNSWLGCGVYRDGGRPIPTLRMKGLLR